MKISRSRAAAAFTLVEVMVTLAVIGISGFGIFEIIRTGAILFGKNSAMNISHNQSRNGLLRLQQDLNAAVSTPELTDSAGNILSSGTATGPAAGVYFQAYAGGPFCLYVASSSASIPSTATSIQVITGTGFRPLPGQTIHIQVIPLATSLLEATLSGTGNYTPTTTSSGVTYTPTLTAQLGSAIALNDPVAGTALHVACFFTSPVEYLVQNGQLVRYILDPKGSGNMVGSIYSYNLSSTCTQPFSMPTVNNSAQNTFLQIQNLTAYDPSSSNRGFKAALTPLTLEVPHFAQLTTKY